MRRIFIDTNIILDLLLKREGYSAAFQTLKYPCEKVVSVLTMANLAYVMRKTLKGDDLYKALLLLSQFVSVEPITTNDYYKALSLKSNDFEDALQYFCACSTDCDCIITRNEKDFTFSDLPILTPDVFLSKITE